MRSNLVFAAILTAALPSSVARPKVSAMPGPVEARVLDVVDGDTLRVAARVWLGQDVETLVRIAGIDAPELHGKCARERAMAQAAKDLLAGRLGRTVRLRDISNGKYAGRVVARVELSEGADAAAILLDAGLARPYGGGARRPWCPLPGTG